MIKKNLLVFCAIELQFIVEWLKLLWPNNSHCNIMEMCFKSRRPSYAIQMTLVKIKCMIKNEIKKFAVVQIIFTRSREFAPGWLRADCASIARLKMLICAHIDMWQELWWYRTSCTAMKLKSRMYQTLTIWLADFDLRIDGTFGKWILAVGLVKSPCYRTEHCSWSELPCPD